MAATAAVTASGVASSVSVFWVSDPSHRTISSRDIEPTLPDKTRAELPGLRPLGHAANPPGIGEGGYQGLWTARPWAAHSGTSPSL